MNSQPLWLRQPRGTAISSLAMLDLDDAGDLRLDAPVPEEGNFFDKLVNGFTRIVPDDIALAVGFMMVFMSLALLPAGSISISPFLAAGLAIIPAAWVGIFGVALHLTERDGELAPDWANKLIADLTVWGRIACFAFLVATIIALLVVISGILNAGRHRR